MILWLHFIRMPEVGEEHAQQRLKALKPKYSDKTQVLEWEPPVEEEVLAFKEGLRKAREI